MTTTTETPVVLAEVVPCTDCHAPTWAYEPTCPDCLKDES